MKTLNIVAPWNCKEAWDRVIHCVASGFKYEQAKDMMKEIGYYLAEDQYVTINSLFDIAVDLDIGTRKHTFN